ncbi:MAG: penicillin-binding protein 2 [Kiritimatiellae bacterium]|nr:penicillin-binding protein 2 [Kiritimatiellia bacterium]
MALNDNLDHELMRVRVAILLMLMGIIFLIGVLWRIQVRDTSKYRSRFARQSMRAMRVPGPRGRIFDRNGVCLADNRPSYCIAIYVEEMRQPGKSSNTVNQVERVMDLVAGELGIKRVVTRHDIKIHMLKRRPLPLLAWRDIGEEMLARWQESDISMPGREKYLPGVAVAIEPVRIYPQKDVAAHIIGFVGYSHAVRKPDDDYDFHLPELQGKYGVEKTCDTLLFGKSGERLMRVDASGFLAPNFLVADTEDRDDDSGNPMPGSDVVLAMDVRIQKMAEYVLQGERGAVVVLDPRNGDVLALASAPTFSPNVFTPRISSKDWAELQKDKEKPLLNRAMCEVYAIGSIFKPVVAFAALVSGSTKPGTSYSCPGKYTYGRLEVGCWRKSGHGTLAMRKALEQSCNTYFCKLSVACGYKAIIKTAEALGMGRKTGINLVGLVGEAKGCVPSDAWKRRVYGDKWRIADTCHLSIGQGPINATPLQMAVMASTIANAGCIYKPRLVFKGNQGSRQIRFRGRNGVIPGRLVGKMPWTRSMLDVVRGGMLDVVSAPTGTGKRARVLGVKMAGKTGTAEYGSRSNPKKHAWMIAFVPFDNPRYAIAMVIEDALSGGRSAAPRIKLLVEEILRLDATAMTGPAERRACKEQGVES